MTETFRSGILSGRLHVLKPAWLLPFDELASHSRVGITPQIGKGGVGPLCAVSADRRKAELENDLLDLREERDEARQAQDAVTDLLLSLVRQVIGTRKSYLYSKGITELDLYRLNVVLRPHGRRARSESVVGSERQVQTILSPDTT